MLNSMKNNQRNHIGTFMYLKSRRFFLPLFQLHTSLLNVPLNYLHIITRQLLSLWKYILALCLTLCQPMTP